MVGQHVQAAQTVDFGQHSPVVGAQQQVGPGGGQHGRSGHPLRTAEASDHLLPHLAPDAGRPQELVHRDGAFEPGDGRIAWDLRGSDQIPPEQVRHLVHHLHPDDVFDLVPVHRAVPHEDVPQGRGIRLFALFPQRRVQRLGSDQAGRQQSDPEAWPRARHGAGQHHTVLEPDAGDVAGGRRHVDPAGEGLRGRHPQDILGHLLAGIEGALVGHGPMLARGRAVGSACPGDGIDR